MYVYDLSPYQISLTCLYVGNNSLFVAVKRRTLYNFNAAIIFYNIVLIKIYSLKINYCTHFRDPTLRKYLFHLIKSYDTK
jgi:hypothetical protein